MTQTVEPKKILLLVEDNVHNRRIFSDVLSHYGFEVLEAGNGEEAIELTQTKLPDLILMDLSLPVLDGWQATKHLKSLQTCKHIPIVALTAHAMTGDEDQAREVGCDGYISKPVSPKQLVVKVEEFLKSFQRTS